MAVGTAERMGTVIAGALTDADGRLVTVGANGAGSTPAGGTGTVVNVSSGNQANANAVATMPAVAGKTNYVTGFEITATGATAAAVVLAALSGILGGTINYVFAAPAGVTVATTPLVVTFAQPVPASAVNTAVVLTLPALGAGNTNAIATLHGFVA